MGGGERVAEGALQQTLAITTSLAEQERTGDNVGDCKAVSAGGNVEGIESSEYPGLGQVHLPFPWLKDY